MRNAIKKSREKKKLSEAKCNGVEFSFNFTLLVCNPADLLRNNYMWSIDVPSSLPPSKSHTHRSILFLGKDLLYDSFLQLEKSNFSKSMLVRYVYSSQIGYAITSSSFLFITPYIRFKYQK
jgi:hypothetical protein